MLAEKNKLVRLDERPKSVFIGDTHGDLDASKLIWNHFKEEVENEETYLVFLGDYVDRGAKSRENIDFLLSKKEENSNGVILLLGNHDAYHMRELRPADFWHSLSEEDYEYYKDLAYLPWIAVSQGLAATHGALPFVSDLGDLEGEDAELFERNNELDIPIWISTVWGDLNREIQGAQMDPLTGRPQFSKEVILQYMHKHDWNILIRAHQPGMQGWSLSDSVLTIFTSQVYVDMGRAYERNVAIVNLENGVESQEDVEVLGLNEL